MNRFPCSLCVYSANNIKRVLRHYRTNHVHSFKLTCGVDGCLKKYTSVRCYTNHLRRHHKHLFLDVPGDRLVEDVVPVDEFLGNQLGENPDDYDPGDPGEGEPREGDVGENGQFDFDSAIGNVLLEAREDHKMSNSSSMFICQEFQKVLDFEHSQFLEKISPFLKEDLLPAERYQLDSLKLARPASTGSLERFSTEKSLDRYISSQDQFVESKEILLGVDMDKNKNDTYQYVPIQETIIQLLKHEDVLAEIFSHQPETDIIESFRDGNTYKEHLLFRDSPHSLMINLYNDEFTITNPLGNKTKTYKILGFYFTLANFHPKLNAKLDSIQLALLTKSTHVGKYGMPKILEPLIEDIKILETVGISFNFQGRNLHFFGTISLVISDNLAAHCLSGFQQNFSTVKRACRYCMCLTKNMCVCLDQNMLLPRTELSYDAHVNGVNINPLLESEYGVKSGGCCLNELEHFHCIGKFPADVAHDFCEGSLVNFLTYLIVTFVADGYFSLVDLNSYIKSFRYCRSDKKDLPQTFTVKTLPTFKVRLTAAECLNFIRLFPFMVGKYVPVDNQYWKFLVNLLDVVELVFAPRFTTALTYYMDERYSSLLKEFVTIYPDKNVTPKMHYGLHYGQQTRDLGPPRTRFTLRYESKNFAVKDPIRQSKNRVNVCKSLAFRHQSRMLIRYQRSQFFVEKADAVEGEVMPVQLLCEEMQNFLEPLLLEETSVFSARGVHHTHGSYFANDVVILKIVQDDYLFAEVRNIFFVSGDVYLFCKHFMVVEFCTHFHAYVVVYANNFSLVKIGDLLDHHVLGLYNVDGRFYVPLKYHVLKFVD